jgi:hypothetical protein
MNRKVECVETKVEYDSQTDAARALGVGPGRIHFSIYDGLPVKGFHFKFVGLDSPPPKDKRGNKGGFSRRIAVRRLDDGEEFDSLMDAVRDELGPDFNPNRVGLLSRALTRNGKFHGKRWERI